MWNYVRLLGKDLFVSPWAGGSTGRVQHLANGRCQKHQNSHVYRLPKGKANYSNYAGCGNTDISIPASSPRDYFYEDRAHTTAHSIWFDGWTLSKQWDLNKALHIRCMQNIVFLGDHPICACQVQKSFQLLWAGYNSLPKYRKYVSGRHCDQHIIF